MKTKYLQPEEIIVEGRFRKDLGSLSSLSRSLLEKGFIHPVTVNSDGQLISGARRYAAYLKAIEKDPTNKLLKKGIPAIIRDTLDEIDEREIELMENIARKDMTWDEKVELTSRIHELLVEKNGKKHTMEETAKVLNVSRSNVSQTLELSQAMRAIPELSQAPTEDKARRMYKSLIEGALVKEMLQSQEEKASDKTGSKKNKKEITKTKAEVLCENYQVGDTLECLPKVKAGAFQMAEVDPPYGIDLKSLKGENTSNIEHYNEIDEKDYPDFLQQVASATYRALHEDAWCIWWYGPSWHEVVRGTLLSVGFKVDEIPGIWYKEGGQGVSHNPDVHLARSYEPFFIARKGIPLLRGRGRANVFAYKPVPAKRKTHPTERPVELIRDIIQTFCFPGARVIVPFLGSGTTLIAAHEEQMGFSTGWDLSEELSKRYMARVLHRYGGDQ